MAPRQGRAKSMQRAFIKVMAETGNQTYAAHKAGYSNPETDGSRLMAKPQVKESVLDAQLQRIRTEGVVVATDALIDIAGDASLPPGARTQAATKLWDISLKDRENGGATKDLHEMSAGELAAERRRLEMLAAIAAREMAEREGQLIDVQSPLEDLEQSPLEDLEDSVFG